MSKSFSFHKHVPMKFGFSIIALVILVVTIVYVSQYSGPTSSSSHASGNPGKVEGYIASGKAGWCLEYKTPDVPVVVPSPLPDSQTNPLVKLPSYQVILAQCDSKKVTQQWVREDGVNDRAYETKEKINNTKYCLGPADDGTDNGTKVIVEPCGKGYSIYQRWRELSNKGQTGTFVLANVVVPHSLGSKPTSKYMCLDLPNSNFNSGITLQIWNCHTPVTINEEWHFWTLPAPSKGPQCPPYCKLP